MSPERKQPRSPRDRFETNTTVIPFVKLRVEPGHSVEMDLSTLANLLELAISYHDADKQKDSIELEQKVRHSQIENIIQAYPGLRGVITEKDRIILTVFPQERHIQWDEELLKSGLGPFLKDVVSKRFNSEIPARLTTPTGEMVDGEQILAAIKKAVANAFGLPEEDVIKVLSIQPRLDIDEKRLRELVEKGWVTLPDGTRIVGQIVWTITTDELKP